MSEQLPPVRVDTPLQERIVEFTKSNGFESTSAAIRHLLKRGLREENVAGAALVLATHSDRAEELNSTVAQSLLESWRDFLDGLSEAGFDIVTLAGGEEEISKEQLAAAYRFQRKEATEEDFQEIVNMLQEPVDLDELTT